MPRNSLRLVLLLSFALLAGLPATGRAQTSRSGSDRPLPDAADIPRLDPASIDAATMARVELLLSGIHGAPDRTVLEAQVPRAREVLLTVALTPDLLPLQRGQALAALAQWPDAGVEAAYRAVLLDAHEDMLMRQRAMLLLGRTFGDQDVATIAPFLGDPDVQMRLGAATVLGDIHSDDALAALDAAARSETDAAVLARIEQASRRLE